jgi:hypothetical protein
MMMKRAWLIILGGLSAALVAYGASYYFGSAPYRCIADSKTPELTWLQQEFHISAGEFGRISALHDSYTAACAERCRQIDALNDHLQHLLAATNAVTPEIDKTLQEAARLRAECQKAMLQHFYAVSQTMPPEQGRRYFDWVTARTFGPEHPSMSSAAAAADHEHHHE